ncbi:MAG TPA: ABC transporter ATP-binding protein [Chloroflexota bacterium]
MARLTISNLHRRYGQTAALAGIDLRIEHGELVALLGPSGCGKTTTLHLLAGFARPDEGEIWSDERLISSPRGVVPPERRNVGMVFQSYALWPHLSVQQNVAFGLQLRRRSRQEVKTEVDWALGLVGLRDFEQRYPHELSGGQQQRVALARAIVVRPDTLLLDEPLSNLDANLREQMRFEIRRVHDETGITMVYVTHDQGEAMVIADRVVVMNAGRIEQIGTPREIYETPCSRFVAEFIGNANCLSGTLVGPGVVRRGELLLRAVTPSSVAIGSDVTLCVRPSALRISLSYSGATEPRAAGAGQGPSGPAGALRAGASESGAAEGGQSGTQVGTADAGQPEAVNCVRGRVVQQAYLGDSQDLRIQVADGLSLRALAPSRERYATGDEVLVQFAADACSIVSD